MPAMEILLAGLPTKILLIMSRHSREMCRLVGKLYFTPMILCNMAPHAQDGMTCKFRFQSRRESAKVTRAQLCKHNNTHT